ncbi:ABC transporter ATP-binding protein [Pseudorhodoferax sp.]|uniref:ABC transporter ATP-binding protein n=1 Tax=Pseudorhodoferax sp. TaxID=1993553 RepID=UPI002DD62487|nr:ATP-binding cassette domain-containing protein [Pseudorhodoferax sp.]
MSATLELLSVRKVYDNGHVVLEEASFAVQPGELMVLVGPSGCGKSTLLRLIAGLEQISSGTLLLDGRMANKLASSQRDVAMVFQSYALYPHYTVAQNMGFSLKLRGAGAAEIEARVQQIAELLSLSHLLDRLPGQLSGGQRQRVALGRALVRNPKLFLLDEPLSNLDAKLRLSTRTEIGRLQRELGVSMIYVTHDQVEAMTLGHRIVVLNEGRIQQIATPAQLYAEPANTFVAGFFGSPPMNLFSGRLEGEGARCSLVGAHGVLAMLGRGSGPVLARDQAGAAPVVGIRPEDLQPAAPHTPACAGWFCTEVQLDYVESTGADHYLYCSHGNTAVVARCTGEVQHTAGSALQLRGPLDKLHFFDGAADGARVAPLRG